MKLTILIKKFAVLLCAISMLSGLCIITTEAGKNDVVIGPSSFSDEISTDMWNSPERDVTVQKGVLIFPEDSTEETRLITTAAARENERINELVRASATMKFTSLPKGESFAFAFGLQGVESYQGDDGNVEISFSNQGQLMVKVTAYADGSPVTVVKEVKCGRINSNITVEAIVASGGMLTLKVSGKTLCKAIQLPVSGEGNVGFVQTGKCGVQVSDVDIVIQKYDAPENCNVEENFDNGAMNSAVLSSKTIWGSRWYPQSLSVQKYNGNQVLRFERCGLAYIGTKYQYSNFEMTFDVPFMQRAGVWDENGQLVDPSNVNFLISFGGDNIDYLDYGYEQAAQVIVFHENSYVSNYPVKDMKCDVDHMIFDKKYPSDQGFSVKISVIDALVNVGLKWLDEKEYSTVFSYTLESGTPTGYIHLWTNEVGNMAVDNIKIINKDKKANLIDVPYSCDTFEKISDFVYEEQKLVFRPEVEKKPAEEGFNWYNLIPYSAIVGGAILVAGFLYGRLSKRKKQLGGEQNEA